jgi:hypothetical protein
LTPPVKSSARQQLAELKRALNEFEVSIAFHDEKIRRLQIEVDAVQEAEADLRRFDASTTEAFALAAQSGDPKALDDVKVDHSKREKLLKRVATAQSRSAGVQSVIAQVQAEQLRDIKGRDNANRSMPIFEMAVGLEELVPVTVAAATEHRLQFETAFQTLWGVYNALRTLADAQPQDGPHRRDLFVRLESLGGIIKQVRETDHMDVAAGVARAALAEFVAGLSVDGQKEDLVDVAA